MSDSSSGQIIGGVAGAVIGTIISPGIGTLYGASLGYGLGGMIDPPKIDVDDPKHPRPNDVQGPTFKHNLPVPIVYGTYPIVGNIMLIGKAKSHLVRVGEQDIVDGGKDGTSVQAVKERWYDLDFAMGLSEGPIQGVSGVFLNQKNVISKEGDRFTVYLGTPTQSVPQQVLDAKLASGSVPWRNTAYTMWHGTIGPMNSMPHFEAYVVGIDTAVEETASNALVL